MVVADILDVWRLTGTENVIALMDETMSDRQEALITSLAGDGQRVTLALPAGDHLGEFVARLASRVYIRVTALSEYLT